VLLNSANAALTVAQNNLFIENIDLDGGADTALQDAAEVATATAAVNSAQGDVAVATTAFSTASAAAAASAAADATADATLVADQAADDAADALVFGDTLAVNALTSDITQDTSDIAHLNVTIADAKADFVTDGCVPVSTPTPTPKPTSTPSPTATPVVVVRPRPEAPGHHRRDLDHQHDQQGRRCARADHPDTGVGLGGPALLASLLGLSGTGLIGLAWRRRRS